MSFLDRLLGRPERTVQNAGPLGVDLGGETNAFEAMTAPPQATEERYNYSPNRLINGGLRDLLGAFADAHAQSQDMDPLYAPKRRQEQLAGAMEGFDQDPLGAIRRLAKIDAPAAQKLFQDYRDHQLKAAKDRREGMGDDLKRTQQGRELVGGILRAAKTPEALEAAKGVAQEIATKFGFDLSDMPDVNDPEAMETWTRGTSSVKDQVQAEYRDTRAAQFDRGLDIQEQNSETSRLSAKSQAQARAAGLKKTEAELRGKEARLRKESADIRSKPAKDAQKRQDQIDKQVRSQTAAILRKHPGARVRTSNRGRILYSIDNGKTWLQGN